MKCSAALFVILMASCGTMAPTARAENTPKIEAITFAERNGSIFLPVVEVASELHWKIDRTPENRMALHDVPLATEGLRQLGDGAMLIELSQIERAGAQVIFRGGRGEIELRSADHVLQVSVPPKRVEISLLKQRLWAWQGSRLILYCRVSSGRYRGSTPLGRFTAGPFKARMHYSRLFNNAPMPWSVQISGNIFIHGYSEVPDFPASHGCIRLPLNEGNPAKFFYEWIDVGTSVLVKP